MNTFTYSEPLTGTAQNQGRFRPRRMLAALDAAAAGTALLAAVMGLSLRGVTDPAAQLSHMTTLGLTYVTLALLLFHNGQYSVGRRLSRLDDTLILLRSLALAYLVIEGASFATKGFFTGFTGHSRLIVFGDLLLALILMGAARWALRAYQVRLYVSGASLSRVIMAGSGRAAADFARFLERRPWLGVRCAGGLSVAGEGGPGACRPGGPLVPLIGNLAEARTVLAAYGASEVIVALDPHEHHHLPRIASELSGAGVPFRVVPSLFEYGFKSATLAGFQEMPMVDLGVDPMDRVQRTLKRALDVATAALALSLTAPALLAVAAAVKLTSPGPVFFRQERVGHRGRHFQMLKFRTMVQDAETRLAELQTRNEAEGALFKIRADPRLTRVGAFLRAWSLDEFPQFWNVLRGDMSVVGPRPPLPREVETYKTQHHCRLKATPGITGLWQVSGRSDLSFDEMVKLDRYYIENWSVGLDLRILLKTAYVVLARKGAY